MATSIFTSDEDSAATGAERTPVDDSAITMGPGAVPLDPRTGQPYWVEALERQFAAADAERVRRERLLRLRKLSESRAARRRYPLDVGDQVGSSPPLSTRLPRWLDEQIRQEFERLGVTHSTGLRQILEEW